MGSDLPNFKIFHVTLKKRDSGSALIHCCVDRGRRPPSPLSTARAPEMGGLMSSPEDAMLGEIARMKGPGGFDVVRAHQALVWSAAGSDRIVSSGFERPATGKAQDHCCQSSISAMCPHR